MITGNRINRFSKMWDKGTWHTLLETWYNVEQTFEHMFNPKSHSNRWYKFPYCPCKAFEFMHLCFIKSDAARAASEWQCSGHVSVHLARTISHTAPCFDFFKWSDRPHLTRQDVPYRQHGPVQTGVILRHPSPLWTPFFSDMSFLHCCLGSSYGWEGVTSLSFPFMSGNEL